MAVRRPATGNRRLRARQLTLRRRFLRCNIQLSRLSDGPRRGTESMPYGIRPRRPFRQERQPG